MHRVVDSSILNGMEWGKVALCAERLATNLQQVLQADADLADEDEEEDEESLFSTITSNMGNALSRHMRDNIEGGCIWNQNVATCLVDCLFGLVVKVSTSRVEIRCSNPACDGFFWVESFQWLKHWHSNGHPSRRLAL